MAPIRPYLAFCTLAWLPLACSSSPDATTQSTDAATPVHIALDETASSNPDQPGLYASYAGNSDTVSAKVCWAVTADSADTCADTTYVTYQDKIHLFKMKGTLPAQEGLVIKITISDADGNKLTKSSFAMMKGSTDSSVSAKPEFTAFTEQRTESRSTPGTVLRDIANHVPRSFGYKYFHNDPVTWAHESTHGINAEIRNTLNKTGKKANGFYVLNGKSAVVVEPGIRKSAAAPLIPRSLRNLDLTRRFDTYVTGQAEWDDRPLYIWDEWNAYINSATVAENMVAENVFGDRQHQDAMHGAMEFTVYAIAVAMAAEKAGVQNDPQFKAFLTWNTERAMNAIRSGLKRSQFNSANVRAYFKSMQSNPDAENFRSFCRKYFGDAFADKVLFTDL